MRELDIIYEVGRAWVFKSKCPACYYVMVNGGAHSESDSAYPQTEDGLSLAKARADYLRAHRPRIDRENNPAATGELITGG